MAGESLQPLQIGELSQCDSMLVTCCPEHSLLNSDEQWVDLPTIDQQHGGRVAPVDRGEHPTGRCEVAAVPSQDSVHEYSVAGVPISPDLTQCSDKAGGCRVVTRPNLGPRLEAVLALQ